MGRWYLRNTREAAQPSLFVAWESGGESADGDAPDKGLVLYVNPELHRLHGLVDAARARLAELEAGFTVEKAQKTGARLLEKEVLAKIWDSCCPAAHESN